MIPWSGWAYLVLLALVGLSGFVLTVRNGQSKTLAVLQLLSVAVLAWGVVLYFRGAGAHVGFAGLLFASVVCLAQKSVADAKQAERLDLPRPARIGVAINGLLMMPAVALGGLAIWSRHGT